MVVAADTEDAATDMAYAHAAEEIANTPATGEGNVTVNEIKRLSDVPKVFHDSLPWGGESIRNAAGREASVAEILRGKAKTGD